MEGTAQPGRKEIVSALTSVLKQSPLKEEIDAKTFFLMISGNFQILFQNGTLDLEPIWTALSRDHGPELLPGIFLQFEDALASLGVSVSQPAAVRGLSAEEREAARERFHQVPEALPLEALKPAIPPERRQLLVTAVVQAVRASAMGPYVGSTQLQYVVGHRLDEFSDGDGLEFSVLRNILLEVEGTDDTATYDVFLRLRALLGKHGVDVRECEFRLSEALRSSVAADVEANPTPGLYEGLTEPAAAPRDKPGPRPSEAPRPKNVEAQLRAYGLPGAKPQGKVRFGTVLLAVALLLAGAGLLYLFQPARDLDLEPYDALLPMTRARLLEGRFVGNLDVERWKKLKPEQRTKALDALAEKLKAENKLRTAAVVNEKGSLCIFPTQDGKLGMDLRYLHLGTELEQKYADPAPGKGPSKQ